MNFAKSHEGLLTYSTRRSMLGKFVVVVDEEYRPNLKSLSDEWALAIS